MPKIDNSHANKEADPGTSECCTCHYKWPTGTDGHHSCSQQLLKEVKRLVNIAAELESRVIWALKFMKCPNGGMMVTRTKDGGFSQGIHWMQWFADGAEMLGRYKVDRELLGLSTREANKILKARKQ